MGKSEKPIRDPGLRRVVKAAGSRYQLAKALDINLPSVLRWQRIPPLRVIQLEKLYGIEREKLRPDLYPQRNEGR